MTAYTLLGGTRSKSLTTANATRYHNLIVRENATNGSTTEAIMQGSVGVAGVMDRFSVGVSTNLRVNNVVVKSRVNGADGAMSVTIPGRATGWFVDTTNSDTLAAGDKICFATVTLSGTQAMAMPTVVARFLATGATAFIAGIHIAAAVGNTNARYCSWSGQDFSGTENDNARQTMKRGGSIRRAWAYIETNTLVVNNPVFATRINGSDGTVSIPVPFGSTGFFEDTTNVDSFNSGDAVGARIYGGGGGSGIVTTASMGATFVYNDDAPENFKGYSGTSLNSYLDGSVTSYVSILGDGLVTTTEANCQARIPFSFTLKNLRIRISGSGSTTNSFVCSTRVNGADGASSIAIPAATVGYFEDSTNTQNILEGDLLCIAFTANGGGSNRQVNQVGFVMDQGSIGGGSGDYPGPGLIIGN